MKGLLREYVDVRLQAVRGTEIDAALIRSVQIHGLLWAQATAAAHAGPGTDSALLVEAVKGVIDPHDKRVVGGLYNRIPGSI